MPAVEDERGIARNKANAPKVGNLHCRGNEWRVDSCVISCKFGIFLPSYCWIAKSPVILPHTRQYRDAVMYVSTPNILRISDDINILRIFSGIPTI